MLHILPGKEKKDPTDEILGINAAPRETFHAFLWSADFFFKINFFDKKSCRNII